MTWWVLNTACWQVKLWQKQMPLDPPLSVSVNMSSQVISHPDLLPQLERVLKATGIAPSSLKLEITESVVLDRSEKVAAVLEELRKRKLELHMDDFGTGYSSLSYLNRLPIEVLKIDRSFVGVMGQDGENAEIVRNILSLAHDLDIEVVAEGVETREQLDVLKALKCEYAQGYFFAKPMTMEKATKWIGEYGVRAPIQSQ
jgi:EAL domain-containing protein (putative c-di-GMP-specific phosphodiesterase class I)